ncbi:MAG: MFS transporter [Acidobacteriaceae bacterium]|nr:MFS transporter [Acidobacteriaceae bacterium]
MPNLIQQNVRGAWWATVVLFLVHGLIVGTWVSRIPAIQSALRLNNGVLGLTLLSSAVGALCAIPVTGWAVTRYGSKAITIISSLAFCPAVVLPGCARNPMELAMALFVFGAVAAGMDVAMNAEGVAVEKVLGKPTMSRFHAMFSFGAMGGAAAGGWAAAHAILPRVHFGASALLNEIAVLAVLRLLIHAGENRETRADRIVIRRIPRVLLALSAIAFCILLSEGAMADWTAIYMRQVLHAGPGLAAEGYAVFAGVMAIFRLAGDVITAHLGPFRTVSTASLVAACGLAAVLCVHAPLWALPGLATTGAGLSVIIPLVFGGGGRVKSVSPGAGIATVTGIGYLGFIAGPPTIGFASQLITLRYALGIVVLCCALAAALSRTMRSLPAVKFSDNAPGHSSLNEISGSTRVARTEGR